MTTTESHPTLAPHTADAFVCAYSAVARHVHATARARGWWDAGRNDGELIALVHSELSEALEGLRHGNPASGKIPAFTAVEEELADVIVRIMDFSYARGFCVAAALIEKLAYNESRERMHGKLF